MYISDSGVEIEPTVCSGVLMSSGIGMPIRMTSNDTITDTSPGLSNPRNCCANDAAGRSRRVCSERVSQTPYVHIRNWSSSAIRE